MAIRFRWRSLHLNVVLQSDLSTPSMCLSIAQGKEKIFRNNKAPSKERTANATPLWG
ncbi:uncharacterized protein FOMMEDRAFT_162642 [Fomitiporia mediterranea MF3/22]|uniref:Uncharacterized protein n=1 Tax=Fomitiporia mediterranea (strain MF3/22) TaxID=694068 RepID=R7SFX6_FOMME|nr:uncharacterized protein FOMMEDRAFT_162642 [Fomitiporia mediterranea MF3/22]EJC97621.1 hypothetical protein FOMMEDRAFT_162642 [Fomitiporia mediterranea MF3/22]